MRIGVRCGHKRAVGTYKVYDTYETENSDHRSVGVLDILARNVKGVDSFFAIVGDSAFCANPAL